MKCFVTVAVILMASACYSEAFGLKKFLKEEFKKSKKGHTMMQPIVLPIMVQSPPPVTYVHRTEPLVLPPPPPTVVHAPVVRPAPIVHHVAPPVIHHAPAPLLHHHVPAPLHHLARPVLPAPALHRVPAPLIAHGAPLPPVPVPHLHG